MEDLVVRNDLYYKKFTDTPFTGEISGKEAGKFKKGIKEGPWKEYHESGQLKIKSFYKNGKLDTLWMQYSEDGQLFQKINYKNGKLSGFSEIYFNNQLNSKTHYDDGKIAQSPVLEPGMTFTIEPMVNLGGYEVVTSRIDGWTVTTKDRSLSAQTEHTILVTENGYEILTLRDEELYQ